MMRTLVAVSVSLFVACGSNDNHTSSDAAHQIDGAGSGSGNCTAHRTVFLATNGGHYAPGADDSRANTSQILSGPTDLAAYPGSDFAAVKTCIVAGLAGFPIDVTDVDPGTTDHIELVFTTTVPNLASQVGATSVSCTAQHNPVAFVEGSNLHNTASVCGVALGLLGVTQGLDYTSAGNDYMSFNVCGSGCSFADAQETCDSGNPGMCLCSTGTTEDPATKLRAALCN